MKKVKLILSFIWKTVSNTETISTTDTCSKSIRYRGMLRRQMPGSFPPLGLRFTGTHRHHHCCPGQFLEAGEISGIISKQISKRQTENMAKIYAKVIPGKIQKIQKIATIALYKQCNKKCPKPQKPWF